MALQILREASISCEMSRHYSQAGNNNTYNQTSNTPNTGDTQQATVTTTPVVHNMSQV